MTNPLVSTAWLAERLEDPGVQVVDATWYMPGEDGSGLADYQAGHIPGAIFFDIDEIADQDSHLPHMLPTPEAFATAMQRLGLSRDPQIVVYDNRAMFSAPRVWWALRAMGFPQVFVLDGGLKVWRAEGRPLEVTSAQPTPTQVDADYRPELVRNLDQVRAHLESSDAQLVDARSVSRFRGEAPEPRREVRSGHMPGALNVPWSSLVASDGTLRSPEELRRIFAASGVELSKPIVTTCGSGVTAALLALGLARLGLEDVPVYDGSWTEWGARLDTPIVTGA